MSNTLNDAARQTSATATTGIVNAGDAIEVELVLDNAERTLEFPDDLRAALDGRKAIRAEFDKQAPSRRKADVDNVVSAKSPETRSRRIAAIVERPRG